MLECGGLAGAVGAGEANDPLRLDREVETVVVTPHNHAAGRRNGAGCRPGPACLSATRKVLERPRARDDGIRAWRNTAPRITVRSWGGEDEGDTAPCLRRFLGLLLPVAGGCCRQAGRL